MADALMQINPRLELGRSLLTPLVGSHTTIASSLFLDGTKAL